MLGDVPVHRLDLVLRRPGPHAIEVDWDGDRHVDTYVVSRNGRTLTGSLMTTRLIDAPIVPGREYCYQVLGYDHIGQLIAATDVACIVV